MRRWAGRRLRALLPDDDWSAEFVDALDEEAEARAVRGGEARAGLWYACQLLRPSTLRFVLRMRARARGGSDRHPERATGKGTGRGVGSRVGLLLGGLGLDVRHAARSLRRDPRVALFVGLTLAIGIGGVTALYGVADRLFLSGPPHVAQPAELVRVYLEVPDATGTRTSPWIPLATARAIDARVSAFTGVTLYRTDVALVRTGTRTAPAAVAFTDLDYFPLLAPRPAAGRAYGPGDADGRAVAVVSSSFARERGGLGVGATLEVAARTLTVVGIAPPAFAGGGLDRIDVWTPLDLDAAGSRNWRVLARLAPDRSPGSARTEAQAVHAGQDPGQFFQWAREGKIGVAGLDRDLQGNRSVERSVALLLLSVVGLVLLVAWVNALNLLLSRIVRRREELGVRVALGIGRLRLVRQLLVETALLGGLGALFALPVAWGAGRLVRAVLLPDIAWSGAALGRTEVTVALGLGALTALLLGALVFPALRRPGAGPLLGARGASAGRGTLRLQRGLATAQVAMSTALLLCAALFLRSFWTMKSTDLGVDADRVWAVDLRSLDPGSWSPAAADSAHMRALARVREADPTARWALSVGIPLQSSFSVSIHVPGLDSVPALPGGGTFVSLVSDGYFEVTGTRLVRGRELAPTAGAISASDPGTRELVVGASTADALWPEADPLGRCVRIGASDSPCWTVVGVAEDVHRAGYREPPSLQVYGPLGATDSFRGATLLARPSDRGLAGVGGRRTVSDAARAALVASDPRVDFVEVRRLDSLLSAEIRPWRLGATMLSLAAGLAVAIALAGVLAVLAYIVAQRRRDIGVRLALGADTAHVRRMILGLGLRTGIVGVLFGLGVVLLAGRWIAPLLFETRVLDPVLMLAVGCAVAGVATLACLGPARSATRIDPIETLRAGG